MDLSSELRTFGVLFHEYAKVTLRKNTAPTQPKNARWNIGYIPSDVFLVALGADNAIDFALGTFQIFISPIKIS